MEKQEKTMSVTVERPNGRHVRWFAPAQIVTDETGRQGIVSAVTQDHQWDGRQWVAWRYATIRPVETESRIDGAWYSDDGGRTYSVIMTDTI